jgi:hypothetical protein
MPQRAMIGLCSAMRSRVDGAQEISESGGIMGADFSVLLCFPNVLLHFAIVMQESGEIDFLYVEMGKWGFRFLPFMLFSSGIFGSVFGTP